MINKGDIAWMLMSSSLVLLMTPAVGMFYGGMVRRKNMISTMMKSFATIAIISLLWVNVGYSLAFGNDHWSLIGGFQWLGLKGVSMSEPNPAYALTIPHLLYMLFQMKFAVIAPALIIGAFVERIRFSAFMAFIVLWSLLVYCPVAHWVWGIGGWLKQLGALDFAGGAVIHITAGVAALAIALIIRKRKDFGQIDTAHSNLPLVLLGTVFLWVGWFGFNGGSALEASPLAVHAVITTTVATSAAALTWMALSWRKGLPNLMGMAVGSVVGLVAITPACGYVDIFSATLIGVIATIVSYNCIKIRLKLHIDESLDVWACHGMAGTWGALATGIFASKAINPAGADGLIYGNPHQLVVQAISVAAVWVFTFAVSFVIAKVLDLTMGLSVTEDEEEMGLDLTQHGEVAYNIE